MPTPDSTFKIVSNVVPLTAERRAQAARMRRVKKQLETAINLGGWSEERVRVLVWRYFERSNRGALSIYQQERLLDLIKASKPEDVDKIDPFVVW